MPNESRDPGAHEALREGPGTRIGPYKLIQQIGEGGFGVVFMAEQEHPVRRRVALKIIKLGMDTRQVVARFEQERQALALMDHANIARVIDAGATETGRPYFVMELVEGEPIIKYCDSNNLTIEGRLELFEQVCNAVHHAHQKGIIHRDLKPSNILVATQDGQPMAKIIDFGVAKATSAKLTDKTVLTEQRQVIGTLQYMSPEQAQGSLDIDTRTDIYSLGVVLYELLTGSTPVDTKTIGQAVYSEVQRLIREVEPPKPSTRLRESAETIANVAARRGTEPRRLGTLVTGELDWIVMRALEKDRGRRYESAGAFGLDVRRFLNGEAVVAAPPSAAYRLRKFVRRNRIAVGASAAVAAALVIGIVAFAWQASIARHQRNLALQAQTAEAEQRRLADAQRDRALEAEGEAKTRAEELQKVADYQAKMLRQIDVAKAGVDLSADLLRRHAAALQGSELTEEERAARMAAFERELHAVNSTDAAVALLDATVLAPAVRTIDADFADQPLVDASLRTTLGVVYESLGRPEPALALYRRAYELRAAELGLDHADTLGSRYGVGSALGDLQKLEEAEITVRATVAGYERTLGADDPKTLSARSLLASQLSNLGKYEDCETITRDVLARRIRVQGEDHPDTLSAKNELGKFLLHRGKYAEAESVLREVVHGQRRAGDAAVAGTLSNLGLVLMRQSKRTEAEPCLREALERDRQAKGEDHPATISAISNLASLLMDTGKLGEAESLAQEALEKCRRIFGNEQSQTLKTMNVMGQVFYRQNKFEETEKYYREALDTGRRVLGEEHPDTIIWTANLGTVLQRLGRLAEAEVYFREAVDKNRRQLGETHPYTITMIKSLGDALRQQDKPGDAEPYYRRALENLRRVEGDDHAETLGMIGLMGSVLRDQGKLAEAEPYFRESVERNTRLLGATHANTIVAILRLASLRVAQQQYAEAITLLTPIQDQVRPAFSESVGALRQASLRGLLGKSRAGLARETAEFAAAEVDLLEAQSVFAMNRGDKDKETREWTEALVSFYSAWDAAEPGQGHDAQREAWRAKLDAMSASR